MRDQLGSHSTVDESDFVTPGAGVPVQFSFYNRRDIINQDKIDAGKPFSTTPNASEVDAGNNSFYSNSTLIANHCGNEAVGSSLHDQLGTTTINGGVYRAPSPSRPVGVASCTSMDNFSDIASPTCNKPFKTPTRNDAIWDGAEMTSLHMRKTDNSTGLTKITINTAGGDPTIEKHMDEQLQDSGQDPGVTIESNYQNIATVPGENDQTTNVVIKRIGGDEIKVNNQSSSLGSPKNISKKGKIEVRPGVRIPASQLNIAQAVKQSLDDKTLKETSRKTRAQEMFEARRLRSTKYAQVSYGTNDETIYTPGRREGGESDDEYGGHQSDVSDPTPPPTNPAYNIDEEISFPVEIAAYDSTGADNILKNLEEREKTPPQTPLKLKGAGAKLFEKQLNRMDKFTLDESHQHKVDALMAFEKESGRDLWHDLDQHGNLRQIEAQRKLSYKKHVPDDDEQYVHSGQPVHVDTANTVADTYMMTPAAPMGYSSGSTGMGGQYPDALARAMAPTAIPQMPPVTPVTPAATPNAANAAPTEPPRQFNFTRPKDYVVPVVEAPMDDYRRKSLDNHPVSIVPDAKMVMTTTFEKDKAPWSPRGNTSPVKPSSTFKSIKAPTGSKAASFDKYQGTTTYNLPKPSYSAWAPPTTAAPVDSAYLPAPAHQNAPWSPTAEPMSSSFTSSVKAPSVTSKSVTWDQNTVGNDVRAVTSSPSFEQEQYSAQASAPTRSNADITAIEQAKYETKNEETIFRDAVKTTSILDVMKSGTGLIDEKQQKIKDEEEKKRKESEGRYRMYMDIMDDEDCMKEDKNAVLEKLNRLDKKLETNCMFTAAQPDEEEQQYTSQARQLANPVPSPMNNSFPPPPSQPTRQAFGNPGYNQFNAPSTAQSYRPVPSAAPTPAANQYMPPTNQYMPPAPAAVSQYTPAAPSAAYNPAAPANPMMSSSFTNGLPPPVQSTGLPSPTKAVSFNPSSWKPNATPAASSWAPAAPAVAKYQSTPGPSQPPSAWTPSTIAPLDSFKVPMAEVPTPSISMAPTPAGLAGVPRAPPQPPADFKAKPKPHSYNPLEAQKINVSAPAPKPTGPVHNARGGVGFGGDMFTKGKGAKMFEKQQARMNKYTREVSDEQVKATKEAALAKKRAQENGTYMPQHGATPMVSVIPQGGMPLKPSANMGNRGKKMSTYTPSSSKLQDSTYAPSMSFANRLAK